MIGSWRIAWFCLVVAACRVAGAAPPGELPGKNLPSVPEKSVTYRVRETHVKNGGMFPGEYEFSLTLRLSVDGQELKLHGEKYEGTPIVPMLADIADFRYTSVKADGVRRETTSRDITLRPWWHPVTQVMRLRGRWDTARGWLIFSEYMGIKPNGPAVHLAAVWAPALVVNFPEQVKLEKGFSWGQRPQEAPRHVEELSYLQQWTLAGVEHLGDGYRLRCTAQCEAKADESGPSATLKREVVYDTGRKLVTRASVDFEVRGESESEQIRLVMEFQEEQ